MSNNEGYYFDKSPSLSNKQQLRNDLGLSIVKFTWQKLFDYIFWLVVVAIVWKILKYDFCLINFVI